MTDRSGNGTRSETIPSLLVDARTLRISGLGRYLREILAPLLNDDRFDRFTLLGDAEEIRDFVSSVQPARPVEIVDFPTALYSPAAQIAWLRFRRGGRPEGEVCFFPHYNVPVLGFPARSVVTVHDLIHFKLADTFSAWRTVPAGVVLRRAVHASHRVISVSDCTRSDLISRFPTASAKIDVVHNGVSRSLESGSGERPEGLPDGPFILCVGNQKPHKNHAAVIEALALLRGRFPRLKLVIAGREYEGQETVRRRTVELGLDSSVLLLGEVPDETLWWLYSHAEMLVHPSFYEGFGLPALEAMTAGTPVVVADRAALPEVVGDAALLFDPDNPRELSDRIASILEQPALQDELVARGTARANLFTWDRAASQTADILYTAGKEIHKGGSGFGLPSRRVSADASLAS